MLTSSVEFGYEYSCEPSKFRRLRIRKAKQEPQNLDWFGK